MPRADAVATAAITFQSRGRLPCWSRVCISFLLEARLMPISFSGVRTT
jgi:hypothetical protein